MYDKQPATERMVERSNSRMLMRVHSTKSIANEPNDGDSNVLVSFIAPGNLKGLFVETLLSKS
jgi:hypothetical protein